MADTLKPTERHTGLIDRRFDKLFYMSPQFIRCFVHGHPDDPDFNNIHIDIGIPGARGAFSNI